MMDERETDRLLSDLFKRNAPYVNEGAMEQRISAKLPRRRRRSRRTRTARILAVGLATAVLAVGLSFGAYRVVTYVQGRPALVMTDSTLPSARDGDFGLGRGCSHFRGDGTDTSDGHGDTGTGQERGGQRSIDLRQLRHAGHRPGTRVLAGHVPAGDQRQLWRSPLTSTCARTAAQRSTARGF